jgi:putative polyhydroxyalkanoate system protein
MPTISIKRSHKLDRTSARNAAQKIASDLHQRFDLVCAWQGDRVTFERPGVSGYMHVGNIELQLEVKLSFLMAPLKTSIELAIRKELDTLFGKA